MGGKVVDNLYNTNCVLWVLYVLAYSMESTCMVMIDRLLASKQGWLIVSENCLHFSHYLWQANFRVILVYQLIRNGHLYLRYGSSSKLTTAKWVETSTDKKTFAILLLKISQEFCYPTQKLRKKAWKFRLCYTNFFFFFFYLFLVHHM